MYGGRHTIYYTEEQVGMGWGGGSIALDGLLPPQHPGPIGDPVTMTGKVLQRSIDVGGCPADGRKPRAAGAPAAVELCCSRGRATTLSLLVGFVCERRRAGPVLLQVQLLGLRRQRMRLQGSIDSRQGLQLGRG